MQVQFGLLIPILRSNLLFCLLTTHHTGGALRIDDGNLSLMGCILSQNESKLSNGGGAWYQNGGTFSISNSSFSQNGSTLQGGAALIRKAGGFFYDSNFSGNYNRFQWWWSSVHRELFSKIIWL